MIEVVAHVSSKFPEANLYAAGWSLGANILVNYMGQVIDSKTAQFVYHFLNPL